MNPAVEWYKKTNLRSIAYEDFPPELIPQYHFLEKIDGGLTAMIYVRGKPAVFLSKRNIKRENLLVLKEYEHILSKQKNIKSIVIIGESTGVKNGDILPFNKTMSVITTAYKNPEYDKMYHHFPFDIYSLNGKVSSDNMDSKLKLIHKLFKSAKQIVPVRYTKGDLAGAWKTFLTRKNAEGLVAFGPKNNYKIKLSYNVDVVIVSVGLKGMKTWERGEASYARVAFMNREGKFVLSTKVGSGFTVAQRKELFKWAHANSVQSPVTNDQEVWVKPERVIEILYMTHYIKPDAHTLTYGKDGWKLQSISKGCSFRNPSLVRYRTDKSANPHDLRLEQIPGW